MKTFALLFFLTFLSSSSSQYDFSDLDQVLNEKSKIFGGKACMLIHKDGKIIYEKNMGGYSPQTKEPIASCSKWITAVMIMSFVDEGKLSLEDTIGKFLPEFSKKGKGKIKISHCLNHTTGIQGQPITLDNILNRSKYKTLAEEVINFADEPVVAKPGDQFYYGNIGLNIAGRILEVISGKNFEAIFQEKIGKPLEMKNTTFINKHAINPSGGIISTPSEYMNFLVMLLNNGKFKSNKILSEGSVKKMKTITTEKVKTTFIPEQAEGFEYSLGSWVVEMDEIDDPIVFSSPGLFGTFPYIDIDKNYAAIFFVHTYNMKGRREAYEQIKLAADEALTED